MSNNLDENQANPFHEELRHDFLHEHMNEIISNGVLSQYYPVVRAFMEQERCAQCCNLILDNYPAVELWMRWSGFNEIEETIFTNAVKLSQPQDIFDEYKRGFEHWPLLFRAVSNQHFTLVKEIIERCPKVLLHVCDNDNVFSFALILDRKEIVNHLLELLSVEESEYSKYLPLGQLEFVTACNQNECNLEVIKKLLDIVVTRKQPGWKTGVFRGVQMMVFKRLDDLPAFLSYFCQTYPNETYVLYEQTEKGDVLLFSLAVDHLSICAVLEKVEKAIEAKDKDGKTLLLRAVEVQNLELVQLLLSKYHINVNEKDNTDGTALSHAITLGNPFMIQCLLEHGAKMPSSHLDDDKIESHVIRCDDEEIINFAICTLEGSITLETFSNVLTCLYNSSSGTKWPWFRAENTRKLFFPYPSNDNAADNEMIQRFTDIYKILHRLKIIQRCPNVFDTILLDTDVSFEQKRFAAQPGGLLHIQMALMKDDPYLEYPCGEIYGTKEFDLIKDYLSIDSFNEVAEGREIPSLKRHCREVIRHRIVCSLISKKSHIVDDFDMVFVDTFDSLPIPQQLIRFLRYQN